MRTRHGVVDGPKPIKNGFARGTAPVLGGARETSNEEQSVVVRSMADIPAARRAGREQAIGSGFRDGDVTVIVAAISELARNIVEYAHDGEVLIKRIHRGARQGLEIIAADNGPGIRDIKAALQCDRAIGLFGATGLTRARWLMDAFDIISKPGRGTTVTIVKWLS